MFRDLGKYITEGNTCQVNLDARPAQLANSLGLRNDGSGKP
jgi:hypothetical protein